MIRSRAVVALRIGLLTLLVDRGSRDSRPAPRAIRPHSAVSSRTRTYALLGIRVVRQFQRRVRDNHPSGTAHGRCRVRIALDQLRRPRQCRCEVFQSIQIVGGRAQHHGGMFVLRKCVREFQRARRPCHRRGPQILFGSLTTFRYSHYGRRLRRSPRRMPSIVRRHIHMLCAGTQLPPRRSSWCSSCRSASW